MEPKVADDLLWGVEANRQRDRTAYTAGLLAARERPAAGWQARPNLGRIAPSSEKVLSGTYSENAGPREVHHKPQAGASNAPQTRNEESRLGLTGTASFFTARELGRAKGGITSAKIFGFDTRRADHFPAKGNDVGHAVSLSKREGDEQWLIGSSLPRIAQRRRAERKF
jgi:hypothetical protein